MKKDKKLSQNIKSNLTEDIHYVEMDVRGGGMNTYLNALNPASKKEVMKYLVEHPEQYEEIMEESWKKNTNPSRREKKSDVR